MSGYPEQVAGALDALQIRSPWSYSWLGQLFEGDEAARSAPPGSGPPWIARRIHARLYGDFFLTGRPAPASGPLAWRLDLARSAVTERLSAANSGKGAQETGWVVLRRDREELVVTRNGLDIWARPDQIVDLGFGTGTGAEVGLVLPNERRGASEGFYTLLGDAGTADSPRIDRHYWHLRRSGGPPLVAAASAVINRARIPFRMKTVNDPRAFRRCDTAVLYTRREDRRAVRRLVPEIRRRVVEHMRPEVPALTLAVAPGLAFAEDPGGGESFGASRCRLIAEAVVRAWQGGELSPEGRLHHVAERFRQEGLDLARPYLGSVRSDGIAPDQARA